MLEDIIAVFQDQQLVNEAFHDILSPSTTISAISPPVGDKMDTASMPCARVLHELEQPKHDWAKTDSCGLPLTHEKLFWLK